MYLRILLVKQKVLSQTSLIHFIICCYNFKLQRNYSNCKLIKYNKIKMVKYLLLLSRKVNKCLTKTQKIITLLKRLCTVFHCFLLSKKRIFNHMSCCTIAFIQSMTWVNKAMLLWLLIYTYFSPRYKISPVKFKGLGRCWI